MKAGDLATLLLLYPDREVEVRLQPTGDVARTLPIRGAGRAPLSERFLLDVPDPPDQETGGQMLLTREETP
jgi:hypothetical protein